MFNSEMQKTKYNLQKQNKS